MGTKHKPIVTHYRCGIDFDIESKKSDSYGRYVEATMINPRETTSDHCIFRSCLNDMRTYASRRFAKAIMVQVPECMLSAFEGAGFVKPSGWDKHILAL